MTAGTLTYETKLDTNNFQKGVNNITNTTKKAGSMVKSIIVGLGITKIISTAISQINQSLDGAISRFDTLNNFPKVMGNLGISVDEADQSIKKMSDKLAGLPTTLDQGASAVQRFTSANGDVSKSTDIFLALNNAIIAGGASADIQASALEQLSQAYSKGKPDMMEWRTAMTAMPAQLKQVADAMGYVNADELGEALRNGTVSMDEFMDTIVKLNEEGIEGFANFEEQARTATGGIGTAITVAKTQIVKGVTDIIEALDIKLENLGIGKISDIIKNAGVKSKKALDTVAKLISGELSFKEFTDMGMNVVINFLNGINQNLPKIIETAGTMLNDFLTSLIQALPQIIQTGMQIVANLIIGIAKQLPTLIPQAIDMLLTIVEGLIDNIDLIIDAGIELILGLIDGLLNALPILMEKVPIIIDKLVTKLTDPDMIDKIIGASITIIVKLGEGLVKALPKLIPVYAKIIQSILDGISRWFSHMVDLGKQVLDKIISGISSKIGQLGSKAGEIASTIINKIASLPGEMITWGRDMIQGLINGIKQKINAVGDAVKSVANKIKSYLHFSRPDVGPLREYEEWMPDMVKGLAKSMKDNSGILETQAEELANKIKSAFSIETGNMSFSGTSGSVTQILSANATFEGTIPMQIDLDGEKIYDNQQKISARKTLQYGGVQ